VAPRTQADDLEWREISGMGTLYTDTIAERPVHPLFADAVPQILAIVEWDEGPRISTEIVGTDPQPEERPGWGSSSTHLQRESVTMRKEVSPI
jgi:uncharacterized OB-fold protein